MKLKKLAGFGIAAVAVASFALVSTAAVANTKSKTVKCYGVSDTAADTACKGKSHCMGKGYINVSKKSCDQLGGTTKAPATTTSSNNMPANQQAAQQAAAAQQQQQQQTAANNAAAANTQNQ